MKILFILGTHNPRPGAAWERIKSFIDKWTKKNHRIEILGTFSIMGHERPGYFKRGKYRFLNFIPYISRNKQRRIPVAIFLNIIFSYISALASILIYRPKVAIISMPTGDVGLGSILACMCVKKKFIIDYRDEWEDYGMSNTRLKIMRSFYARLKRFATVFYAKSVLIVTVTKGVKQSLLKRGLRNVEVVTNGADLNIYKPTSSTERFPEFTIFYSGLVGKYYRIDVVIKALKSMLESGYTGAYLKFAGWGDIKSTIDLASELKISDKVEYLGIINDKHKLSKLIARSTVGVIPFDDNPLWKNALPAKFFEYCACGIPVIASAQDNSILANHINNYNIGKQVTPLDADSMSEAFTQLYMDPDKIIEFGTNARTLIENEYDREKNAVYFLELLIKSLEN